MAAEGEVLTLTALNDDTGVAITTTTADGIDALRKFINKSGLTLRDGEWERAGDVVEVHTAGVAYGSREGTPGLWMDAFPFPPTQLDVLRAFFDEMVETGEVNNVSFDQFLKRVQPNVVVLSPEEQLMFAARKKVTPKT